MFKVTQSHDVFELYTLSDSTADAHVVICPARGGMVTAFTVAGRPVLHMEDESFRDTVRSVHGGIPILFPIAGPLRNGQYVLNDVTYSLPQHGFARTLPWTVGATGTTDAASLALHLHSSDATRQHYPFDWDLDFTYRLAGSRLLIEQRYHNRSDAAMPFYAGLHPYFRVPPPAKASATVAVEATRFFDVSADRVQEFDGTIDLAGAVDMDFLDHRRAGSELTFDETVITLSWSPIFSKLVVWTVPNAPFICVEPYMAAHYAMNTGEGVVQLPPGSTLEAQVSLELRRPLSPVEGKAQE